MTLSHACAVAAPQDLAGVRLLRDSLALHHPQVRLTVAALPGALRPLRKLEGIDIVTLDELEVPELDVAPMLLPAPAAAALARPLLLARALAVGADSALLLTADCDVRNPLTVIEAALGRAEVVLLPRVDGRLPVDGERPDADDLLAAGELDDEVLAVRTGAHATKLLTWWLDHVVAHLRIGSRAGIGRGPASPLRTASRTLDGIETLGDPGYGVSAWNLHERSLTRDGRNVFAAGRPVHLMRFAGFRPDRPWWLSADASRVRVLDDAVLSHLCRERAAALFSAGWEPPNQGDEKSIALAQNLRFDERLQRLLLHANDLDEEFGDLTEPAGAAALLRWLEEPAPAGAAAGINRYTYDVWSSREDIQRAYPQLDHEDGAGFVGWLWVHGRAELGLDARLLPPAPDWVTDVDRSVPSVEVLGYLRGNLGLGQAARGYASALRAAGVPVGTRTVPLDGKSDGRSAMKRRPDEHPYEDARLDHDAEVLLVCVNAPQLPGLVDYVGEKAFADRYVIGQWGWETDAIPDYWQSSFSMVDEIWVYSHYVADCIAAVSPKPVVVVPLPVEPPARIAASHGLTLPEGQFTFLFAFDFLSTLQRKNPLGLIEAFKEAFFPGEGPRLVLKTTNQRLRPEMHDRLRHAIDGRHDIAIVDASLTPAELAALFADADCYVSLHRSEGFGLTLAESMVLGKPVIATGFGGNLDFMSPSNSHLVEYEMTTVGPNGEHYPAEGTWAEPSLKHAASLMREVWENQEAARALGDRARLDITRQLAPAAVGAIARRRLVNIPSRAQSGAAEAPVPYPGAELDERLRFDITQGTGSPSGARGIVRRGALRAMRPYTVAERRLDEALVVSIRKLATELENLRAARDRDRDRIARLERRLRGS